MMGIAPPLRRKVRPLRPDQSGVTALEFALVAPVLLLLLIGVMEIGHMFYVRSILQGEMVRAGRANTLEHNDSAQQAALDESVRRQVLRITAPGTSISFNRTAFATYSQAKARAEPFIDANGDGYCSSGESFEDWNGNSRRDLDGGRTGRGNPNDAVIYAATVSYPRFFPMPSMLGWSERVEVKAQTVLLNQPYGEQVSAKVKTC